MAQIAKTEILGEYIGNGCCCTPACYKVKIEPHCCCPESECFVQVYPGCCGCGPYCCYPCGMTYYRCTMFGPNTFVLFPYGDCQKFPDKDRFEPCCCGCGTGCALTRAIERTPPARYGLDHPAARTAWTPLTDTHVVSCCVQT